MELAHQQFVSVYYRVAFQMDVSEVYAKVSVLCHLSCLKQNNSILGYETFSGHLSITLRSYLVLKDSS
jgi:hypothetical protein